MGLSAILAALGKVSPHDQFCAVQIFRDIMEPPTTPNLIQQQVLSPPRGSCVAEILCCGTKFRRPSNLLEHEKIHRWENKLIAQELWASKANERPSRSRPYGSSPKYGKLKRTEFRVLNALPSTGETDVLQFRMSHISLETAPNHTSLYLILGEKEIAPHTSKSTVLGLKCQTM